MNVVNKTDIISEYRSHSSDTGSEGVQVALLQSKVIRLTEHLKANHKDYSAKKQLLQCVAKVQSKLRYIATRDMDLHDSLVKKLSIRIKNNKK